MESKIDPGHKFTDLHGGNQVIPKVLENLINNEGDVILNGGIPAGEMMVYGVSGLMRHTHPMQIHMLLEARKRIKEMDDCYETIKSELGVDTFEAYTGCKRSLLLLLDFKDKLIRKTGKHRLTKEFIQQHADVPVHGELSALLGYTFDSIREHLNERVADLNAKIWKIAEESPALKVHLVKEVRDEVMHNRLFIMRNSIHGSFGNMDKVRLLMTDYPNLLYPGESTITKEETDDLIERTRQLVLSSRHLHKATLTSTCRVAKEAHDIVMIDSFSQHSEIK